MLTKSSFPLVLPGNLFRVLETHDKFIQEMFQNKNIFSNYPPTDVYFHKDNENTIYMDIIVAGFTKDEIEISVIDKEISVKGTHKTKKDENANYITSSISYKNFERNLTIENDNYFIDTIEPNLENGVLKIKVFLKQHTKEEQKKIIPIL